MKMARTLHTIITSLLCAVAVAQEPTTPDRFPCAEVQCPTGCQEYEYSFDTNGCDVCTCKSGTGEVTRPPCPELACPFYCQYDYALDENGCEVCACKTVPAVSCLPEECFYDCPFGFERDSDGCETCACKPDTNCRFPKVCKRDPCAPGVVCPLKISTVCVPSHCDCRPHFYDIAGREVQCTAVKLDACENNNCLNGGTCVPAPRTIRGYICECPSCSRGRRCQRKKCPANRCDKNCEFGYVTNDCGCELCICLPEPCDPPSTCLIDPCDDSIFTCDLTPDAICVADNCNCTQEFYTVDGDLAVCECPPVFCDVACEFGNVLDEDGCPTCECREVNCTLNSCEKYCPFGYVTDKDGCELCICLPEPCDPPPPCFVNPCDKRIFTCDLTPDAICVANYCHCTQEFYTRDGDLAVCAPVIGRPCAPGTTGCANDGTCVPEPDDSGFTCQCTEHYYGKFCENDCPPVCEILCQFGNVLDDNGCRTCECRREPCPMFKCKPCLFGYETDSNGCQTCQCKPNPIRCPGSNVAGDNCDYPCDGTTCLLDPSAICIPNYCGGCHYEYYYENATLVDCKAGHPCYDGSHRCAAGSTCRPSNPDPSDPSYTCDCPPTLTGTYCEQDVSSTDICAGDTVSSSCASACGIPTCEALRKDEITICTLQCVFGCVCPNGGRLDKGNACVEPEDCGCIHNGVYYSVNESYEDENQICRCDNELDSTPTMTCRTKSAGYI
ncbi:neurogenic locus notch homolog protein 1-like isoform X2 [Anneissia japonica]|uniref:neurogenic locus notch homolog protein 1-like isoform X2 n=1 Tax=Anneissia japonica TaxID=1529436 RepID=UPI0014256B42|nr:neurogenic locus notch homolog protein 1-like isoform X2 [Anneissia japonica]